MNNQRGFERLLGLSWMASEDVIYFSLSLQGDLEELMEDMTASTKRMMLSYVMKFYGPLGLVSPLIVQGKIINQEGLRAKVDREKLLTENIFNAWKLCHQTLQELNNVRIPRCYFQGYDAGTVHIC